MQIRKASGAEMLALWGYPKLDAGSPRRENRYCWRLCKSGQRKGFRK